jgi:HTH-type transcriptional regulator/antitoxin HigA
MARRSAHALQHGRDDNYLGLVRAFPLRPIRSESELDRAIEVIDSLIAREDLDSGQEDYLDVLGDLVHKYEAEHDPMVAVSDADMVRFLLESNEMAQTELAQRSGIAESSISEILAGKRKLSRRHIAALSRVFRVSPAVFFPEVAEMTPERIARILSRRSGWELSRDLLVSLASAFACDSDRACWRALQELVSGDSPGTPTDLMANRLNSWSNQLGGGSCWWPASFNLTAPDVQALADAFSSEKECWKFFQEMVEETIPDMRAIQREIAEEN